MTLGTSLRRARLLVSLGVVALLAAATSPASAESRYSLRGFGEPTFPWRADLRALAGAGSAASIPSIAGNPAAVGFLERGLFTGTYQTEWVSTKETLDDGATRDRAEYNSLIPNLSLQWPLGRGLAIGVGFLVERRRGGIIETDAMTPDSVAYRQRYEASGNLLTIPLVVGLDLEHAQFGVAADVTLLNSKERWRNIFDVSGYVSSNDLDRENEIGLGTRLGLRVPYRNVGAIGAWTSLPAKIRGERHLQNDDITATADELRAGIWAELPTRYGLGLELTPVAAWRVLGDWTHEAWSDAKSGEVTDERIDVDRVSAGVEWTATRASGLTIPVRLGFRTENLHFLDARQEEVRETALTAGTGFGFAGGRGQFDWLLEYGWRGDASTEYEEKFVRFGVSVSGYEEWSRRTAPEAEEDW
ncbi:MAG: hypothetical protein KC591_02135 [Gemmatimonadetes bacterium]|nr:hypothetical protein [Gemmatimonadota bacterium]